YLAKVKTGNTTSRKLLVWFLVIRALPELGSYIYYFYDLRLYLGEKVPILFYFWETFRFAYVPLLFFYLQSVNRPQFKLKIVDAWHFLPSAVMFIFSIKKVIGIDPAILTDIVCYQFIWSDQEFITLITVQYLQFFAYMALSLNLLNKKQFELKKQVSSLEKQSLKWLIFIIWGLILWKGMRLIETIAWWSFNADDSFLKSMHIVGTLLFLFLLNYLFLKVIRQPYLLLSKEAANKEISKAIPDLEKDKMKSKLLGYMNSEERPYLNPTLSLQLVAEELSIASRYLSYVINEEMGMNFRDFINQYRIEECKKLLETHSYAEKTVSEIMLECGFNSKSVFNQAFKKNTGTTPSMYRKGINNS
ncbi:helix-turn-helix domain-containing protein, partial [Xanthovirga aplysinae]|uniref:helix-turn-helix domain-containing protein n=1 Tax=Xanthovirga aplysinae TaxID=2529853 RepID=UPI0012BD3BFF